MYIEPDVTSTRDTRTRLVNVPRLLASSFGSHYLVYSIVQLKFEGKVPSE